MIAIVIKDLEGYPIGVARTISEGLKMAQKFPDPLDRLEMFDYGRLRGEKKIDKAQK